MIIAAVEAGGTKFVAGLLFWPDSSAPGQGPEQPPIILETTSVATVDPETTMAGLASFFRTAAAAHGKPETLGIGSFGPVELRKGHPLWGRITTTPKLAWRNFDLAGRLGSVLGLPAAFDTDVNAAALAEGLWGAARGLSDYVYLTIGTGIGGGVVANGRLIHGAAHPELGHLRLAREASDGFAGTCPYHGDCLEGLASGPAIGARWGKPGPELPSGHPAWELEARYLARAAAAFACLLAPQRVLLGGGVGLKPGLAEQVAEVLGEELAGYMAYVDSPEARKDFVQRPLLGSSAGLLGAGALALGLELPGFKRARDE